MKIEKFTLGVLGMMPLVESLNGAFQGCHVSDLYRIFLLVLICISLVRGYFYVQILEMLLLCLFFVFLVLGDYTFLHGQLQFFLSDLKSIFRILLAPVYYVFFNVSILKGRLTRKDLVQLLSFLSILYSVLVIVPSMFGLGFATYDTSGESFFTQLSEGVGSKGYFIEVNSLCAILMGFVVFTGESFFQDLRISGEQCMKFFECKIHFVGFWLNCISLLLLGTKTGLVFVLTYFCIFILRILGGKKISKHFRIKFSGLILSILLMGYVLFYNTFVDMINGIFGRGEYFYNQFEGNLLTFITSSRSMFLKNTLDAIVSSKGGNYLILFGGGYTINLEHFWDPIRRVVTEMDWCDFFFSYGLVGLISYVFFFRKGLINYFRYINTPVKLLLLLLFIYSIFAGHVLFNSMTATILAICLAYISTDGHKESEES
jgi:hypothetical protein